MPIWGMEMEARIWKKKPKAQLNNPIIACSSFSNKSHLKFAISLLLADKYQNTLILIGGEGDYEKNIVMVTM